MPEENNNENEYYKDDRITVFKVPEGNYRVAFCNFFEIERGQSKRKTLKVTWAVLYPSDSLYRYKIGKEYKFENGVFKNFDKDLKRIFGDDLKQFKDELGKLDTEKLMWKEAEATVIHKYDKKFKDPLSFIKAVYPPGKFKFQ